MASDFRIYGEWDNDRPHPSGEDRYAIYAVALGDRVPAGAKTLRPEDRWGRMRRRIAETSRDGIGTCLVTLHDEGQITGNDRIGILDRETRQWIINPWAKGRS